MRETEHEYLEKTSPALLTTDHLWSYRSLKASDSHESYLGT